MVTTESPCLAASSSARVNGCDLGRSVADATKPNVAVGPPLSPAGRERGWGREWALKPEHLNQISDRRRARTNTAVASPATTTNTNGNPSQGEKSIKAPDMDDATSAPSV